MEREKNLASETTVEQEGKSIDFQLIYTTLILNWKWFLLSIIICLGLAVIYLRYKTPVYEAYTKMLIKEDDESKQRGYNLKNITNLGMMSASNGIDNEMEILTSRSLSEQVVRDLKLNVMYYVKGKIKNVLAYKNSPYEVSMNKAYIEALELPINLTIKKTGNSYLVTGKYAVEDKDTKLVEKCTIEKTFQRLPATLNTKVGAIKIAINPEKKGELDELVKVTIVSPRMMSYKYMKALSVNQTSKTTSIVRISVKDESIERAEDYLEQLAVVYNRQANEDKNEVARRTETFINSRLEKINAELGNTEGELESYKKRNNVLELTMSATQALTNTSRYDEQLTEAQTQVILINSLQESMNTGERYGVLPVNVGITDASINSLIDKYNTIALDRKRLLQSASENSPTVMPLTNQLDELNKSIRKAMAQVKKNYEIQRNAIASQYSKYVNQIGQTPSQERMLTQIGRQQEVKSGLYLMLLQKREENSISLAATADKGRLIDTPESAGKINPKTPIILLVGLMMGILIPGLVLYIIQFFRYKIEGHEDVIKLTKIPLIADVAVASETAKTKAGIVVHENTNNQMEEIFRAMRTNIQFLLKEGQKTIIFTSTTSGEGKTFNAVNLAISFALLGKKVILVGLDIRKPRIAELFEINDHHHGITNILVKDQPTWEDVKEQMLPSGINKNLDLLMAGPIPPNPAELVARKSLELIVDELKAHYDYVIIDTAPVGLVTDTLQIGRVADATVYMCRADYTPKDSFHLINELSKEKKLPNMCIVLNGIDMSEKKHSYYYGYGKYGKYGRYGKSTYGSYGSYGNYSNSHYGNKNDNSVKL